jgi:hypothetical protein
MSNIFQPQVAEINSAVTPQEGVVDTSGVELFSLAAETGLAVAGKERLKSLERDLDDIVGERADDLKELRNGLGNISQAMEASNNKSGLLLRARALVDKTRADAPWVKDKAEALYSRVIGAGKGGGGGNLGGVFSESPEEKELSKFQAKVAEKQLANPTFNANQAAERVRLDMQRREQKEQFELLQAQGKAEGDVINNYVNQTLATSTVRFMDKLDALRAEGGGSIDATQVAVLERQIMEQANGFMVEALKGLTDAEGNPITNAPNKEAIDGIQADIDDWVQKSKDLLKNSSTTEMIASLNRQSSVREQQIIHNSFDTIDILAKKGGQVMVQDFLEWADKNEGTLKDYFAKVNPRMMELLGKNSNVKALLSSSYNKLIGVSPPNVRKTPTNNAGGVPIPYRKGLTDDEAIVMGTALVDPTTPRSLVFAAYDRATESEEAKEAFTSLLEKNPDSFKQFFSEGYSDYLNKEEKSALGLADLAIGAAKKNYYTQSHAGTGSFMPTSFEIKTVTPSGKFGVPRVTAVGSGLSTEMVGVINNTYRMFNSNPKVLKNFLEKNGLPPETDAKEATQIALLKDKFSAPLEVKEEASPEKPKEEGGMTEDEAIKVLYESEMAAAKTELEKERVFGKLLRGEYRRDGVIDKAKAIQSAPKVEGS